MTAFAHSQCGFIVMIVVRVYGVNMHSIPSVGARNGDAL